ncbi:hypothetical protein HPB47_010359, partial [Ixodes persulcatus]
PVLPKLGIKVYWQAVLARGTDQVFMERKVFETSWQVAVRKNCAAHLERDTGEIPTEVLLGRSKLMLIKIGNGRYPTHLAQVSTKEIRTLATILASSRQVSRSNKFFTEAYVDLSSIRVS